MGHAKRDKIPFPLVAAPSKEVVQRSEVSSCTVSLIRKEIAEALPLYRNPVPSRFVPFSYLLEGEFEQRRILTR